MAWGVTPTGFNAKPLAQIVDDINAALISNISPTLNVSAASAVGQIVGTAAGEIADGWDVLQAVYSAYDPDQAASDQLASLALVTGTIKRGATSSVAQLVNVNVNPGTYAIGQLIASVQGAPASTFSNAEAVVNSGVSAANFPVDFEAQATGPIQAPTGTLTVIASPVVGWNSVTNPTDAIVGLPVETDPQLRIRRVSELEAGGGSTADSIRAGISTTLGQEVGGDIISVSVNANDTDTTDVNGLPPHSFETIALGSVGGSTNDTLLAQEILNLKTAGDTAYGVTTTIVVNDSQGNPHTIKFTRPTSKRTYVAITVQTDPKTFPSDGAAEVAAALATWSQTNLVVGADVIIERIISLAFTVPGVNDVPACAIGFAPSPVGTINLVVGVREIATISSGDVVVTVT